MSEYIVFFDGVCNLCSRVVRFIVERDPHHVFRFAPLQGETAKSLLTSQQRESLGSLVLLEQDLSYERSTAVIRIFRRLGVHWKVLSLLLHLVPRSVRDLGYDYIAKNRYGWFGEASSCDLGDRHQQKHLFLP